MLGLRDPGAILHVFMAAKRKTKPIHYRKGILKSKERSAEVMAFVLAKLRVNPLARTTDIACELQIHPQVIYSLRGQHPEFKAQIAELRGHGEKKDMYNPWYLKDLVAEARRLRDEGNVRSIVHLAIQLDLQVAVLTKWYRQDRPGWKAANVGMPLRDKMRKGECASYADGQEEFRRKFAELRAEGVLILDATYQAYEAACYHAMANRRARLEKARGMDKTAWRILRYPHHSRVWRRQQAKTARERAKKTARVLFRTLKKVCLLRGVQSMNAYTPKQMDRWVARNTKNVVEMKAALAFERARVAKHNATTFEKGLRLMRGI